MNAALLTSGSPQHLKALRSFWDIRCQDLLNAKDHKEAARIEQRYRESLKELRARIYFPY